MTIYQTILMVGRSTEGHWVSQNNNHSGMYMIAGYYIITFFILGLIVTIINQCTLSLVCPCLNGGKCTGADLDGDIQEDCDCTGLFDWEGTTCEVATGIKPLL